MTTPPGWYADPDEPQGQRYWDGKAWTEHRAPVAPPPPAGPAHAPASASSSSAKTGLIVGGVLAAVFLAVVAIGALAQDDNADDQATVTASTPQRSTEPDAEPTDAEPDKPVTYSLKGEGNTPPFTLSGGDYRLEWETGGNCYYGVDLEPTRGSSWNSESVFTADKRTSGEQFLYGVKAGDYYLSAITGPPPGCPWTVTITGQ